MALANTHTASRWRSKFDNLGIAGLLAVPTLLPPFIFLALLILQHHTA